MVYLLVCNNIALIFTREEYCGKINTDTTSDITNADVYQSGTISSWKSFRMVKNSDGTYRIMSTHGGLYRALNAEMDNINAGKTPINCIFYQ